MGGGGPAGGPRHHRGSGARGAPPEPHDTIAAPRDHHPSHAPAIILQLRDAAFHDALGITRLHPLTLDVRAGELLGVAGVEGAGQHELMRLLAGRLKPTSGEALLPPSVGFAPEDRHRDALALTRSLAENVALRGAGQRRGIIGWNAERGRTARLLAEYDVRGGTPRTLAANLSGGNQQKLVLGRELDDHPPALIVESPTRGLDARASAAVLDRLRAARERGTAVVVYSSDIDELLQLATRVVVAHAGRLREVPLTREAIGRALVGAA